MACLSLYFFKGYSLSFFSFLLISGSLGFWGLGLGLGFKGWSFQLKGFEACGVEPCGFLGLGLSIQS